MLRSSVVRIRSLHRSRQLLVKRLGFKHKGPFAVEFSFLEQPSKKTARHLHVNARFLPLLIEDHCFWCLSRGQPPLIHTTTLSCGGSLKVSGLNRPCVMLKSTSNKERQTAV